MKAENMLLLTIFNTIYCSHFSRKQFMDVAEKSVQLEKEDLTDNSEKSPELQIDRSKDAVETHNVQCKTFDQKRIPRKTDSSIDITQVVNDINNGYTDAAAAKFAIQTDESKKVLPEVIKKAYHAENEERLLDFLGIIKMTIELSTAFKVFYEELQTHNRLNSAIVLELQHQVNTRLKLSKIRTDAYSDKQAIIQTLEDLAESIKKPAADVLRNWGQQVRDGQYWDIKRFANKYSDAFRQVIAELVKIAYRQDEESASKLIDLGNELYTIEATGELFLAINEQLQSTKSDRFSILLRIARELKVLFGMKNYNNVNNDLKQRLDVLWNSFPADIREVASSGPDITQAVKEINDGKTAVAAQQFIVQTAESQKALSEVVQRAYTVENEERLLDFMGNLKLTVGMSTAFKVFHQELQRHNRLNNTIVLELQHQIDRRLKLFKLVTETNPDTQAIIETLEYLAESIKEPAADVLRNWGQQVRDAQYGDIKRFANKYSDAFRQVIAELVKNAYRQDEESASKLIDLGNELYTIEATGELFLAINEQLQSTKSDRFSILLRIARELKVLFGMKNYNNVNNDLKQRLDVLWKSFPGDIREVASRGPDITQVVNEINDGKTDAAATKFDFQTDETMMVLPEIIKEAYKAGNNERLLDFLGHLKLTFGMSTAFKVFYEELQKDNRLNSTIVLELQHQVNTRLKLFKFATETYADTQAIIQALEELSESIKKPAADVLRNWGQQVRDGQYGDIKRFANKYSDAFRQVIEELVKNAYRQDDDSASKLIDLANELSTIEATGKIFLALNEEMQPTKSDRYSIILRIARELKVLFGMENYIYISLDLRRKLDELCKSFPADIRAIVSGGPDITQVVKDINDGYGDAAAEEFAIETDENSKALPEVIKKAYKLENEESILDFLRNLEFTFDLSTAFKVFCEELQKNNRLNSTIILELRYQILRRQSLKIKTYSDTQTATQLLDDLAESIKKPAADVLRNWGQHVRDAQYGDIKRFANNYSDAFQLVIEELVKNAYRQDDASASKLIDLANELSGIEATGELFIALNKQLQSTKSNRFSPILRIASKLQVMLSLKNINKYVNTDLKQRLDELWKSFPADIRAVASGDPIYLKNDGFPVWNYLVVRSHYDKDRDTVVAAKYKDENMLSYLWRIKTYQDGQQVTIKTEPMHHYLYAAGDFSALNDTERKVFTWVKKEIVYHATWELRSHDWENGKYYLYNTYHKGYLNVRINGTDTNDVLSTRQNFEKSEVRIVYSSRKGGNGDKTVWAIQPANTDSLEVTPHLAQNNSNLLNECETKILQGDYKTAASMLLELEDGLTSELIKRAYSATNSTQIMDLIAQLPWLENDTPLLTATACIALMDEMQSKNDLDNSDILLMRKYTNLLALTPGTKQISDNITAIIRKLEPYILDRWAKLIINNTHDEIIRFIEKHHEIFYEYPESLLKRIYDISRGKAQYILNFAYDITVAQISAKVLTDLHDYMVQFSEDETLSFTLQMAHRIREVMSLTNFKHAEMDLISKMERLWENQLPHIKLLIRNSPVCMKNKVSAASYYLYTKNHMDENRDRVMATADVEEHMISSKWDFETSDRTKTFRIKSHDTKDYLYAGADFFAISEDKRRVLSWRGGDRVEQGVWQLHAQADQWKNNKFLLYNTHYKQYLNVIADDSTQPLHLTVFDKKNAFTWQKDGYGPNPNWTFVEC